MCSEQQPKRVGISGCRKWKLVGFVESGVRPSITIREVVANPLSSKFSIMINDVITGLAGVALHPVSM